VITLRRAVIADCEQIARVHAASIRTLLRSHYTPEQLERWAASLTPERYVPLAEHSIVATDGEPIAGFAQMQDGEIQRLYIDPAYVRRGIGAMLLRELERLATCSSLRLSASLNAVPFYEAMGFRSTGEAAWNGLKVVTMEKRL
jgi:ribosomal protein S18 acetylase RimI-like enzyme